VYIDFGEAHTIYRLSCIDMTVLPLQHFYGAVGSSGDFIGVLSVTFGVMHLFTDAGILQL